MTIAVETVGTIGSPEWRTFLANQAGMKRGLAVVGITDDLHVAVAGANAAALGFVNESTIGVGDPASIVMEGEFVAKIGGSVTRGDFLSTDSSGQVVTAVAGDNVVAMAVSSGQNPGDYIVARVVRFVLPS